MSLWIPITELYFLFLLTDYRFSLLCQRVQCWCRMSQGVWGLRSPSTWTTSLTLYSSSSLMSRYKHFIITCIVSVSVTIMLFLCGAGLIHPEPCRHHAEHWEHHRRAGLYLSAAGSHGEGAGGDSTEVREGEESSMMGKQGNKVGEGKRSWGRKRCGVEGRRRGEIEMLEHRPVCVTSPMCVSSPM